MKKLLNAERFKHVSYHHTDVAATFKREIDRLKEEAARKAAAEEKDNVRKLKKGIT